MSDETKQQKFQTALAELVKSQKVFHEAIILMERVSPICPHLSQVQAMRRYKEKISTLLASLSGVRIE